MSNHMFNVDNFGVNDGVLKMYFKNQDIKLAIAMNEYLLEANDNSIIEYDLATNKIINRNEVFKFVTENGLRSQYSLFQLINFEGMSDAIKKFAEGILEEDNIKLDDSTHELMGQIMDYHKEEIVNMYLDSRNYDELKKINLIL